MNHSKKIICSKRGLIIVLSMLLLVSSCKRFARNSPSQIGTYYPDGRVAFRATPDQWDKGVSCVIVFSQPAEIKAVGKMTNLFGDYTNVVLITPIIESKTDCQWAGDAENYFIEISWLEKYGRIEYTGNKESWDYFWESGLGTITKVLIIAILVLVVYQIIRKINIENERTKANEEKRKIEEEERAIRAIEMKTELEIERRKNIVYDISNNLYQQTLKEVNRTLNSSLKNELFDISIRLHSENMNELIINGSESDFQNIINSIKLELSRLHKLALKS